MKKIALLCILFSVNLSQSQNLMWAKRFAGNNSGVEANAVTTDRTGNVFTTGAFVGFVDFDPGPGTGYLSSTTPAFYDIFVSKLNLSGSYQWARYFAKNSGTGNGAGHAICTDSVGNSYITGYFNGTVNFETTFQANYPLTAYGSTDIFVLKLDPNGNFVWAVQMGGTSAESGLSIAVDPAGNVYTTGRFIGVADFDPGIGVYNLASVAGDDIFVSKLNASGNFVWAKRIGGVSSDWGNALVLDASSNVGIAGFFYGTVDFDPGPATFNLVSTPATDDAFFMKLDNSGNFLWVRQINGTGNDQVNAMVLDAPGNIYVAGAFNGVTDFDPGVTTYTLNTYGSTDVFVSKYDASGNFVWTSRIGGPSGEEPSGIAVTTSGDVYTTGAFFTVCDFDPGPGTYNINPGAAGQDDFVSKLNPSGAFVSAKKYGGTGSDRGTGITADPFGDIIFTGHFPYGTGIDFEPGTGNYTFAPIAYDGYVAKLSDCTTPATITASQPGSLICSGQSLTVTASGASTYTLYPALTTGSTQIITPTVSTVFTLIGTNSASCRDAKTFSVAVNPSPTVTVVSSNSLLCAGQTATLSANGALSYSWSTASNALSISVTPAATTTYTVIGTNSVNCTSAAMITVTVDASSISLSSSAPSLCAGQNATLSISNPSNNITYTWTPQNSGTSIVVNPLVTTTYSISGTNSITGCMITNTFTLPVYAATFTVTSPTALCLGQTATLTAAGAANNYSWTANGGASSSSVVVSPTANTSYSVTGTLSNCSATQAFSIMVNPLPNVAAYPATSTICQFDLATLTANGATSYTWNTGANTPVISPTLLVTTSYTVTGTDANGCNNSAVVTQSVQTCTGIDSQQVKETPVLSVFPNPNSGIFMIRSDVNIQIHIINALGQLVYTYELSDQNQKEITVNNLRKGIYFISGQSGEFKVTKKIIVVN